MRPARAVLGLLVAAQVRYGRALEGRLPASTRSMIALMLAASAAEAMEARGVRRGALVVATAGAIGSPPNWSA